MTIRGITINALPEAAEPTTLAEVTGLLVAATGLLTVIVWPFLIGFALWLYRKPITHLIGRVRTAKGWGVDFEMSEIAAKTEAVEVEAGAAVEKAEAKADGAIENPAIDETVTHVDQPEGREAPAEDLISTSEPGPRTSVYQVKMRNRWNNAFINLLKTHPPSALLFAWEGVEERLRKLADYYNIVATLPSQIIRELHDRGVLPPVLQSLLLDMWQVRQQVMHDQSDVTFGEAQQYRASVKTAERELDRIMASLDPSRPKN